MPLYIVDTWKDQFSLPGKQATAFDDFDAAAAIAEAQDACIEFVYSRAEMAEFARLAILRCDEQFEIDELIEDAAKGKEE